MKIRIYMDFEIELADGYGTHEVEGMALRGARGFMPNNRGELKELTVDHAGGKRVSLIGASTVGKLEEALTLLQSSQVARDESSWAAFCFGRDKLLSETRLSLERGGEV